MKKDPYFNRLKKLMDEYAHLIYKISRQFPKEELYGVTSQIRRSALSVALNFIEGFARQKSQVKRNFWEIAYGSLKESKYLIYFSLNENYLSLEEYSGALRLAEEIGAMLWKAKQSIN